MKYLIWILLIMIFLLFELNGCKDLFTLPSDIENMESNKKYQDPELENDPLYLAKLNASNISVLKDELDSLSGLKDELEKINSQVEANTVQIDTLNANYATSAESVMPTATDTDAMTASSLEYVDESD